MAIIIPKQCLSSANLILNRAEHLQNFSQSQLHFLSQTIHNLTQSQFALSLDPNRTFSLKTIHNLIFVQTSTQSQDAEQ
jgi:hypothetical protein